MDPQFVELSEEITRNVSAAVTQDVTEAVTRDVTAAVTRNVTAAVTRDVTTAVTEAVTAAVNGHVTELLTAAEERLAKQAQINVEAVKEVAKLAAEGYAASLDTIHRRLDRIESAVKLTLRD